MNYTNGKIYKIVSDLTDKIYIGSTCSPLNKRHYAHKQKDNKCKSKELIKLGETRIELIEDYPCERKEQLYAREGYYIRLNKAICINKVIMGRTDEEYRIETKDLKQAYYKKNIDNIKEYKRKNKEHYADLWQDYYKKNKDILKEKAKIYNENNKEIIAEKSKIDKAIKINCLCGEIITKGAKYNHLKTKKHIAFIQSQQQV